MGILSRRHHVDRPPRELAALAGVALGLQVAAGVGMAYVAGFDDVRRHLLQPTWYWLAACFGAVAASFGGYYFGYRGAGQVEEGPQDLDARTRLAVVGAGFGGFLAYGGGPLDEWAMRSAGASEREARVRVTLIASLEHGVLAIPCSVAAMVLVVRGIDKPPHDFTIPWSVGPAVGFVLAFWAAERYRARLHDADGWRGKLGVLYEAVHLLGAMFRTPPRYPAALAGMLFFWLCDMFALWAAIAAFGDRMNFASTMVAFGTAMIVTRRTGPFGGAGILMVVLPPTLWYSGADWAPAVLGVFAYRSMTLWLPLPFSLLSLPRLRRLGRGTGALAEARS